LEELVEELYLSLAYFSDVRIKTRLKMSPKAFREQWQANNQQHHFTSTSLSTSYKSPLPPRTPPSPPGDDQPAAICFNSGGNR
jgi:hypothetical protein